MAGHWLAPLLVQIQADLGQTLDLGALARRSGLSPCHSHRVFREHTGETPRRHIERLRMERAFLLLAASEERIRMFIRPLDSRATKPSLVRSSAPMA